MANADLQAFIENRLLALDPSVDLTAGSPAQVGFITPILTYLGTDPFETDIDSFLTDRFRQEYPDIYASDPSAVRDAFVKPLILFLEPFKREIQLIKRNQSLADPTVLSDQDADALVANVFDERSMGGFSTGVVRCYFANPSNVPVEMTVKFFTASGLNFFPTVPTSMTAEQMVFNRQGALYYMDITVKAEQAGSEYNIDPGDITGQSGLFGVAKVTNLRKFQDGTDAIDTPSFVAQARESLNERSLLTRRGANARIRDVFRGQVRAVQVIGAGDEEMQRDLLVGSSTGHAWLTGRVTLYQNLALVQCRTVDDVLESPPQAGNILYVYLAPPTWSLDQRFRFCRLTIEEVIGPAFSGGAGFQVCYVVRWSGSLPGGVVAPLVAEGGCIRNTTLRIFSLPDIGKPIVDLVTESGSVHVFGHSDIYVRPVAQDVSTAILTNIVDEDPILERTTLHSVSSTNQVTDDVNDFLVAGVEAGDILSIESGDNTGTYVIGRVAQHDLFLTTAVAKPSTNVRYRISRKVTLDPFDPKVPKLPFATVPANDLQTVIATNLFQFSVNTIDFGVKVGDVVRVKRGLDQGDFTITGFDASLGGRGVLVDRKAGGSAASLEYEIFTPLEKVEKPLVRIRELLLLDSAKKSTGITIPPADPIAVVPTSDFTTAQTRGRSYLQSGFVLPAFRRFIGAGNISAADSFGNDRRYTENVESTENGIYKAVAINPTKQVELLFPGSSLDTCSWFAMTVEDTSLQESVPPVEVRAGDTLNLTSGPNKGGYIVKDVRKFRFEHSGRGQTLYFIQIYGAFAVDVFGDLLDFLEENYAPDSFLAPLRAALDSIPLFESFFSDFYASLGAALYTALTNLDTSSPPALSLQAAAEAVLSTSYEVGSPARGVLRSYFLGPTLFQQNTADNPTPTLYDYEASSGELFSFRPDPLLYPYHLLLPARGAAEEDPKDYPRDVSVGAYDPDLGANLTFSTSDKPTIFALGVEAGDILALHEEVFLYGVVDLVTAVQTVQGLPRVQAAADSPFTPDLVGNIVAIEEGDDAGTYYIIDVPDSRTLVLDRALTSSTPEALATGASTSWGIQSDQNVVTDPTVDFTTYLNKWVTLYKLSANVNGSYFQGSFRITGVLDSHTVVVDVGSSVWPSPLASDACCVVTDAPDQAPTIDETTTGAVDGVGTKLVGARPIRIYQDDPTDYTVYSVRADPVLSQLTVRASPVVGLRQPYSIRRSQLRRVNPLEMSGNQEGALYYFDTDVVSLSSSKAANIPRNTYLTVRAGTYESQGYRHQAGDKTLTYSMKETGTLELPTRLLPPFSVDRRDSELSLVGSPLQVSYERAQLVEDLQAFLDSVEDRVTSANMLARHFLPAYVSYDAQYKGGSSPSVVAKDIINYVNNLAVETPIDISEIQYIVEKRGGNLRTPTTMALLIHDWSRKLWAEFSEDEVGGTATKVPYDGTPRVSYFVPGPDVSGQSSPPPGERINLTKL